jgi:tRNA (mo5U34)-methyltransferase
MDNSDLLQKVYSVKWYHTIQLTEEIRTPGVRDCNSLLEMLNLPEDCRGMRALDIGTADGFFAFELERRGAEVITLDYKIKPSFLVAKEILKSNTTPILGNVYSLSKEKFGEFDLVLFLGVLYHLRNPLLALDRIRSMYLETTCIEKNIELENGTSVATSSLPPELSNISLAQFHPMNSLHNDYTNYWSFNAQGLRSILKETLFNVTNEIITPKRCLLKCEVASNELLSKFIDAESGLWPFDPA